jgi:hypothetical protein
LPADAFRERILNQVLTNWAINNPSGVAGWLVKAEDFPEKHQAIRQTADLWQRLDFSSTLRWVAELPEGSAQTTALQPIATHIRNQPQEKRAQELEVIHDPKLRKIVEDLVNGASSP